MTDTDALARHADEMLKKYPAPRTTPRELSPPCPRCMRRSCAGDCAPTGGNGVPSVPAAFPGNGEHSAPTSTDGRDYDEPADVDRDGVIPSDVVKANDHHRSQDAPDVVNRAVVTTLADVVPERLSWLWPGRLPAGKLVTLDGDPAVGKSTVAVDWAARVSTGADWPDDAPCPVGDVIILSAEDGLADTIRPRLDAAGGDEYRVHALSAVRTVDDKGRVIERPPTLADVDTIKAAIVQRGARLLIVDVLMAYMPGKVDAHRDQDVRAVLHRLADMATETGCTVLLLRHMNKSGGGSPMYRGGGSIGIVGAARAGYLIAPDPDDPAVRVLANVKTNLAEEPDSLSYRLESAPGSDVARVVWQGVSEHRAAALLDVGTDEDRTERNAAADWLRDYLTEYDRAPSRDAKKAAHGAGFSDRTLARARNSLRVAVSHGGFPRQTYWSLPGSRASGATDPQHSERGTTGTTGTTGSDQQERNADFGSRASRASGATPRESGATDGEQLPLTECRHRPSGEITGPGTVRCPDCGESWRPTG